MVYERVAALLAWAGVIDRERLDRTVSLSWPRIVTGFAIMSKQTVDLALVGWAVGSAAVAGLAYAYAYWTLGKFVGIGLAGGAVALVSQNYGGDETGRASLVVKQGVWVALAIVVPVAAVYAVFAEPLIGVLGSEPVPVGHGVTYLVIVAPALAFEYLNLLMSRTYAGVGDTFTPMVVRATGGVLNIVLSVAFILAGMGVAGVALGTLISTAVVTVVLGWGVLGGTYPVPGMQASPVTFSFGGPQLDRELGTQLVTVSAPLIARGIGEMAIIFPLLWIAGTFGPVVVAAFEVGRRVRDLLVSFSWGFSTASSTLVGQELGGGDEAEAAAYGGAIVRLSFLVHLAAGAVVFLTAPWIAQLFVSGPGEIAQAAVFVRVSAVAAVLLGANGAVVGALRGAGDTRWPFVATVVGQYAVALPVAAAGLVSPLGVAGLYGALVLGAGVPAIINVWRYRSGRWKVVSREYRPSSH
ncbi:MATE family efflux transporter [Halovenus sp. HT40]|uniref:MATE family efflux transporter n=1 Tax=Halovenus sp. HT40 TaxID=3126691 RepID=UPI00300F37F8